MCGIFGALDAPGEVHVERALDALRHRGPDHRSFFADERAILGHARLSILDLSAAANQPMVSADGGAVLVFNGEIYNHHELRRELVAAGHVFRTRSDTEVILEGYLAWGDGVVPRLSGMFAFAIWEPRARRLLLARDRSGKKPLYYARRGRELRFASEPKALFASGLSREVDPSHIPGLLALGYVHAPNTMYVGVHELPPASTLGVDDAPDPRVRAYVASPFLGATSHDAPRVATAKVRALVEAAVVRRLEADVPLGAFLSGGVDSTIVVGIMQRSTGRRVRTFSIGFAGDDRYDETRYARLAAAAFGTDHTEFRLEPSSFDLVERLVWIHDAPFGDSSAIPTSVVSRLTRQEVTVALSGDGGDELFCGYQRFVASEMAEAVPRLAREAGWQLASRIPAGRSDRTLFAKAHRFFQHARRPLAARLLGYYPYFASDLELLLRGDFARSVDAAEPLSFTEAVLAESRGRSTLRRILDHNYRTYLPYDLLVKTDRSSMLHSLEVRAPLLDNDLVAYAATLPDHLKRRFGLKWILKRAFRDLVPEEILSRKKMGFGVPLGAWFRGELSTYLRDHFTNARLFEYLDRAYVDALVRDHMQGRADHSQRLWLLLTLEIWLRSFGRSPGSD